MKQAAHAHALTYPKTFRAPRRLGTRGRFAARHGETGDMWVPLAKDLARDHTVVVPDLRGMGLSTKPTGGYDKKTQAGDVAGILDALKIERAALVTHDIGNMVGYAFAAQYRNRVTCFVVIDAPLPGVGPWEEILKNPLLWYFRFGGPDMERLVAGRERIYLDRFWNEFSATPKRFSEAARRRSMRAWARCMRGSRSSRPSVTTHPACAGRAPAATAADCARALRMAARALRPLRRPVSTIEQRAA
jgi:pimeloyl-ACP methyl ester carboxylesterase